MLECVLFASGGTGHNEALGCGWGRGVGGVDRAAAVSLSVGEFGCGCWLGLVLRLWGLQVHRGDCITLQGCCSGHSKAGQADRHAAAHPTTKPTKPA